MNAPAFSTSASLPLRYSTHKSTCVNRRTSTIRCSSSSSSTTKVKSVDRQFSEWATSMNISMPSLILTNYTKKSTISRGLSATAAIKKRSSLVSVPSSSALQVTTTASEKPPDAFPIERSDWRRLSWYTRLALMIISIKRDPNHELYSWINRLPFNQVDVPHHWSPSDVQQLQNERLESLLSKQKKAYNDSFTRVSNLLPKDVPLDEQEFIAAIDCVRSRAFSGTLETAPFQDRLRLFIFIAVNTAAWPLLSVLSWENAFNGGLTAIFSLAMFDIILPKVQKIITGIEAKRYAIVAGIDMFNHNGIKAKDSQVEYRYFTNSYEILSTIDYNVNDQVFISYGQKSNDSFLQYYSFVEDDNPYDDFVFDDQVSQQLGLAKGRLVANVDGFDQYILRTVKKRIGGSNEKAIKLLREMCKAQLSRFETSIDQDKTLLLDLNDSNDSSRLNLAIRYRLAKKILLQNVIDNWEN